MACDYTEDDLKAIKSAYAQGAFRVKYADKEVEYRSLAEMKQIIAEIEACLYPNRRKKRTRYVVYTNNYNNNNGCGCGC